MFSLEESQDQDYDRIVLGLHNSNIAYFTCDDEKVKDIRLYWENPTDEEDMKLTNKSRTEKYLHELRIMRRFLQDLNWGEAADEYYARIMDNQLELKRMSNPMRYWLQRWIFKDCFGWGAETSSLFFL